MIRLFDQETFSDPKAGTSGDCTRACFRTYAQAEMPLLPHPIGGDGKWNPEFHEVLEEEYGLYHRTQPIFPGKDYGFLPRVVMAAGLTDRSAANGTTHLVIYDRIAARVVHDPHPSRSGLIEIRAFDWLVAA